MLAPLFPLYFMHQHSVFLLLSHISPLFSSLSNTSASPLHLYLMNQHLLFFLLLCIIHYPFFLLLLHISTPFSSLSKCISTRFFPSHMHQHPFLHLHLMHHLIFFLFILCTSTPFSSFSYAPAPLFPPSFSHRHPVSSFTSLMHQRPNPPLISCISPFPPCSRSLSHRTLHPLSRIH